MMKTTFVLFFRKIINNFLFQDYFFQLCSAVNAIYAVILHSARSCW